VAVQVETFPLKSVTVSVTVFAPTFAQLNVDGETLREAIPQASEDPLSICEAVMETVPEELRSTFMFWQTATGAMLSTTATVEVQVETFPFTSVTVNVTGLSPTPAQVNEEGVTDIEAIAQLSELPLLICAAVMVTVPEEFN